MAEMDHEKNTPRSFSTGILIAKVFISKVFFSITPCLHQCEMHSGSRIKDGSCRMCEATDSVFCPLPTSTGLKELLKPELGMRANQGRLSRSKIRKVWQLIQQKGSPTPPDFG